MEYGNKKKQSNTLAWTGLILSLVMLALTLIARYAIFTCNPAENSSCGALWSMIAIGVIGVISLICSIGGLVKAIRNGSSTTVGILGIVVLVVALIVLFGTSII